MGKEKGGCISQLGKLKSNATLRNRLQKRDREEFIIDAPQPPAEIELRRDRFAPQFQAIADPRVEIEGENERRCEENNPAEMVDGDYLEAEKLDAGEWQIQMGESILRPKRRTEAGSLEKKRIYAELIICEHGEIEFAKSTRQESGVIRRV